MTGLERGVPRTCGITGAGLLLAAGLAGAPAALESASPVGHSWTAWLGCWEPVEAAGDAPMRCFRAAEDGVEILTVVDTRITEARTLAGHGAARRISEEGCDGTERVWFSGDGDRLYRSSRLLCDGIRRTSTTLWALLPATEWLEVRSVEVEGRRAASVTRYRPAAGSRVEAAGLEEITEGRGTAVESARLAASGPPGVDDVVEAHGAVGTEVVEAWIAEQGEPLRSLRSRELLRLADAGVPARIIDVAVAVTYPDRFQVDRKPYSAASARDRYAPFPPGWGRYSLLGPPYWGYRPYWGYGGTPGRYWDPYRWRHRHYGQPFVVVVREVSTDDGNGGRVVAGRGYSRRSPGQATPGGTRRPAGEAAVSSPGSTSGRATGRKAKPRGSGSSGSGSDTGSGSGSGSGAGGSSGG